MERKTSDDIFNTYIKEVSKYPLLTCEEVNELSIKIQKGDTDALHKLINSNLRFVIFVAKKFVYTHKIMDIIQEGNVGLIEAAKKYSPSFKVSFAHYSKFWILAEIWKYLRRNKMIPIPDNKKYLLNRIKEMKDFLFQELCREPTNEEIARELNISEGLISELTIDTCSLDSIIKKHDGEEITINNNLVCVLKDDRYLPVEQQYEIKELKEKILVLLTDEERKVLLYFGGLKDGSKYTLKECQSKLNLNYSRETIRQRYMSALRKVRKYYNENLKD